MFRWLALFVLWVAAIGLVTYLLPPQTDPVRIRQPENTNEEKPVPVFEKRKTVRDVTPDEILQAPRVEEEVLERLPAIEPPPLPEKPPEPVAWKRSVVVAAGLLKNGDKEIVLSEIEPLDLDETCKDKAGKAWPCGRFARTALRQFLRNRTILCDPTKSENGSRIETSCRINETDISAWLVKTGWARPAGEKFATELEEAQSGNRGMWRDLAP